MQVVINALATGLSQRKAMALAKVDKNCFRRWRELHPDFAELADMAVVQSQEEALSTIFQQGFKDWRAAAEYLKLTEPKTYAYGSKIHSTQVQTVSIDDAQVKQLSKDIEQAIPDEKNRRILALRILRGNADVGTATAQ